MTNFELQKSLHEKNLYIEELQEEINILKQKEFDYEWEKRGLLNQIDRIEQKLQNALFESSISHGMVSKLNALKSEIEDLKSQIESGRSRMLITEKKLKGIASERDSLALERENLLDEREELLDKLGKKDQTINELKERQSGALAIREELDRMEKDLQATNESLAIANNELEQANWEILNKEQQLKTAQNIIESKEIRISEMKAEIENLKSLLLQISNDSKNHTSVEENSEVSNEQQQSLDSDKTGSVINSEFETEYNDVIQPGISINISQSEEMSSDDSVYLPELKEQQQATKRSIETIIDLESDQYISAEEFFYRDKEEIARISRYLAESDELGKDVYVCAKCLNRVKIAKREIPGKGEVLFFTHCKKDITCDWKKERVMSDGYVDYSGDDITYLLPVKDEDSVSRYKEIKELILRNLESDRSKEIGISNVQEDVVIKSDYRFMRWRRAGITAEYNGRSLVFELQTKNVLMNTIVSKDIFFRLHNQHVIWIFGADEENGYGYMQRHAHQNTMFFNRRNVFFIDDDSIRESEQRGELVLKCNYLDPDDKWHFRKETTSSNGTFVTLENLIFDDDMCKPYYFDANRTYFDLHPGREEEYLSSLHTREEIVEDLQYQFDNPDQKEIYNRKTTGTKTRKPHHLVEKIPIGDNKYIYGIDKVWGVITGEGERLVEIKYDEIDLWAEGKYRVRKADKWGIVNERNEYILNLVYHSISSLKSGAASVSTGVREFEIDIDGNELAEKTIALKDGLTKFRMSGKWGIINSDREIIVDNIYDEIGSFRSRLIGFINGKAIKLSTVYDYRVPVECKCIGSENGIYLYEVGNVKCRFEDKRVISSIEKDRFSHVGVSNMMALVNILWNDEIINLRSMNDKDWEVPFNHVDNSYDFLVGEVLTATVTNILYGKRLILKFEDRRESYMSKAMAFKSGIPYASLEIGLQLTIKKVGFDEVYDRTIWEVV